MDFNADKYLVEDSHALTEAEKVQFARDLIELERPTAQRSRDRQKEITEYEGQHETLLNRATNQQYLDWCNAVAETMARG